MSIIDDFLADTREHMNKSVEATRGKFGSVRRREFGDLPVHIIHRNFLTGQFFMELHGQLDHRVFLLRVFHRKELLERYAVFNMITRPLLAVFSIRIPLVVAGYRFMKPGIALMHPSFVFHVVDKVDVRDLM